MYSYEIKPQCFGEEAMDTGFNVYIIIYFFKWARLYEMPGYVYDLFIMFDKECEIEESIYDIIDFCSTYDCTLEKQLENDVAMIFQITGILNSIGAVYYNIDHAGEESSEIYKDNPHMAYFDMVQELGLNLGKLIRFQIDFDPEKVKY